MTHHFQIGDAVFLETTATTLIQGRITSFKTDITNGRRVATVSRDFYPHLPPQEHVVPVNELRKAWNIACLTGDENCFGERNNNRRFFAVKQLRGNHGA